jgi:hypothetical protein
MFLHFDPARMGIAEFLPPYSNRSRSYAHSSCSFESLKAPFQLEKHRDEYQESLHAMITAKLKGLNDSLPQVWSWVVLFMFTTFTMFT